MKRTTLAIAASLMAIVAAFAIAYAHQDSNSGMMGNMMGNMMGEGNGHQDANPQMMRPMHGMMMGNMMGDHSEMMMNCPMMRVQREESFYLELKEEIGLSEEQVKSLQSIQSAYQMGRIKTDAEIQIAESELNELLEKDDVELSQMEAKIRAIEALRAQQRIDRIKSLKAAGQLLTEAQKAQIRSPRRSSTSHQH